MDPVKFSETLVRFREHTIRLQQQRHRTILTNYVPTSRAPAADPAAATKAAKSAGGPKKSGPQCSARTLEGRQCPFGASPECSGFCRKHFSMK